MKPGRRVSAWTIDPSLTSTFTAPFDFGTVIEMTEDGALLTEETSKTLDSGEWFYDASLEKLFVRGSDDSDPSDNFMVATYEIYVGTKDAHFNRVPTDATSKQVYYEPVIQQSPTIRHTQTDANLGVQAVESSGITLLNGEHFLEKHVHDSSFRDRKIDVYHYLLPIGSSDIKTA